MPFIGDLQFSYRLTIRSYLFVIHNWNCSRGNWRRAVIVISEFTFSPCRGIRILNPGTFLLVESENLGFGIRNTVQGFRNPRSIGIRNPSSIDKESGIHGVESRSKTVPLRWFFFSLLVGIQFSDQGKFQESCKYMNPVACANAN